MFARGLYARMFWRYNRPLKGGISSLLYVRKQNICSNLRLVFFSCKIFKAVGSGPAEYIKIIKWGGGGGEEGKISWQSHLKKDANFHI